MLISIKPRHPPASGKHERCVPPDFQQVAGDGTAPDCSSTFALGPGARCNLSIEFAPTKVGLLVESLTLSDNFTPPATLDFPAQTILLASEGQLAPATLTSPAPNSVLAGPMVTFTWGSVSGATGYSFRLGTTVGANNLYGSGEISTTSATTNKLPLNGETVHGRLFTYFGSSIVYSDYTFTAAAPAVVSSPASGIVLPGASATFTWNTVPGATGYSFRRGTTAGANDLYGSGIITTTSATATNLPVNGQTIHGRLFTYFGSSIMYSDSSYIEATSGAARGQLRQTVSRRLAP